MVEFDSYFTFILILFFGSSFLLLFTLFVNKIYSSNYLVLLEDGFQTKNVKFLILILGISFIGIFIPRNFLIKDWISLDIFSQILYIGIFISILLIFSNMAFSILKVIITADISKFSPKFKFFIIILLFFISSFFFSSQMLYTQQNTSSYSIERINSLHDSNKYGFIEKSNGKYGFSLNDKVTGQSSFYSAPYSSCSYYCKIDEIVSSDILAFTEIPKPYDYYPFYDLNLNNLISINTGFGQFRTVFLHKSSGISSVQSFNSSDYTIFKNTYWSVNITESNQSIVLNFIGLIGVKQGTEFNFSLPYHSFSYYILLSTDFSKVAVFNYKYKSLENGTIFDINSTNLQSITFKNQISTPSNLNIGTILGWDTNSSTIYYTSYTPSEGKYALNSLDLLLNHTTIIFQTNNRIIEGINFNFSLFFTNSEYNNLINGDSIEIHSFIKNVNLSAQTIVTTKVKPGYFDYSSLTGVFQAGDKIAINTYDPTSQHLKYYFIPISYFNQGLVNLLNIYNQFNNYCLIFSLIPVTITYFDVNRRQQILQILKKYKS